MLPDCSGLCSGSIKEIVHLESRLGKRVLQHLLLLMRKCDTRVQQAAQLLRVAPNLFR